MAKDIRVVLGKRIKIMRAEKKFTQQQLAEKTGIDYKYIQRIEGKNPPNITIKTIDKIAKALKVPVKELIDF